VQAIRKFLSRPEIRSLKQRVRLHADAEAAIALLADSVLKGHDRLAVHRFCVAHALDETRTNSFAPYCDQIAAALPPSELQRIVNHVNKEILAMGLGATGGARARD
jgi:hypothetical protein